MNQLLTCIADAGGGYEIIVFTPWVFVNALGVIGLVVLVGQRYLAATILGCVPLISGMGLLILTLYWHRFDLTSVVQAAEWNLLVVLFPGIPLVLGLVVFLLGYSGYRKARGSAERHPQ